MIHRIHCGSDPARHPMLYKRGLRPRGEAASQGSQLIIAGDKTQPPDFLSQSTTYWSLSSSLKTLWNHNISKGFRWAMDALLSCNHIRNQEPFTKFTHTKFTKQECTICLNHLTVCQLVHLWKAGCTDSLIALAIYKVNVSLFVILCKNRLKFKVIAYFFIADLRTHLCGIHAFNLEKVKLHFYRQHTTNLHALARYLRDFIVYYSLCVYHLLKMICCLFIYSKDI